MIYLGHLDCSKDVPLRQYTQKLLHAQFYLREQIWPHLRPSNAIAMDCSLHDYYRNWIRTRVALDVLRRGDFEISAIPNKRAFILKRSSETQRAIAVFNLGKDLLHLQDLSLDVAAMDVLLLLEKKCLDFS